MTDVAHLETDAIILAMEKKLRKEYKTAVKETEKKLLAYMLSFVKKDAVWKARLLSGDAKMSDYVEWRKSHLVLVGWLLDVFRTLRHRQQALGRSMVFAYGGCGILLAQRAIVQHAMLVGSELLQQVDEHLWVARGSSAGGDDCPVLPRP